MSSQHCSESFINKRTIERCISERAMVLEIVASRHTTHHYSSQSENYSLGSPLTCPAASSANFRSGTFFFSINQLKVDCLNSVVTAQEVIIR